MKSTLTLIGSLLKLDALAGVRTYIAAAGLVGLSLSQFSQANYDAAITSFLAALALVGLHDQQPAPPVV